MSGGAGGSPRALPSGGTVLPRTPPPPPEPAATTATAVRDAAHPTAGEEKERASQRLQQECSASGGACWKETRAGPERWGEGWGEGREGRQGRTEGGPPTERGAPAPAHLAPPAAMGAPRGGRPEETEAGWAKEPIRCQNEALR